MEVREIIFKDKTKNKISVFLSDTESNTSFICLPAMGVRAKYYELFASSLSKKGFNVITADWRGQGSSSTRPSHEIDFGYKEYISDLHELVTHSEKWFPNTRKILIGHSLGGQLASLFSSRYSNLISHLILITSCNVHYKGFHGLTSLKVRLAGNIFYPASKIVGYFPGNKIGFAGKEAKTVIKDWSYNAIKGDYKLSNSDYDYEDSLNQLIKPVLSISIKDDDLASKKAVENLYQKFNTQSTITHIHIEDENWNHFSWAKMPDRLINIIQNWVHENSAN
ncbi:MAG: alpha/beta fold hydrolase [Chitinophagales bacterium]|nr:alpha/beta fold hydrolase [Chitinophagales bacterium]